MVPLSEKQLKELKEELETEMERIGYPDNFSQFVKLALFWFVHDRIREEEKEEPFDMYSFSGYPMEERRTIQVDSDNEFLQAINGKDADKVWAVIGELMDTIALTNPRLYAGILRKIEY